MGNLIDAQTLMQRLDDPQLRLVDARFELADPEAGGAAYGRGHLPGAVHLDLDRDLSSPPTRTGTGGRHPLPDLRVFTERLGELGIGDEHHVVVYDEGAGMFAARAWWLLRYVGHERVQVLDGGLAAWREAGGALTREVPSHPRTRHGLSVRQEMAVDRHDVQRRLGDPSTLLVDARAADRYRGEREPIDPRAGHIPSAVNLPFMGNLHEGRFRPPQELRERYAAAREASEVVVYCGSGVSAAHDVLAMEEAGLPLPRLYVGSWSDWCSDPAAPAVAGEEAGG